LAAVLGLVSALVLMAPNPAAADVTGGCTGSADFSADSVGAYTPDFDTKGNPIIVPKADGNSASWEGSVPGENRTFGGEVEIRIGWGWIVVADWGFPNHDGENVDDERSDNGVYNMDELWDVLPKNIAQGIYEARATHAASGVACEANFFVKFEGSALSSPIVIGAIILLAVFLVLLAMAGRSTAKLGFFRGRPVLAVISAILAAVMIALLLQQFSVWPLDNVTTLLLPAAMIVLGLLLAKLAPFGGGAPAPLADLSASGEGSDEIFADGFESGDTSAWTDDN
jgi:hypothetical protein